MAARCTNRNLSLGQPWNASACSFGYRDYTNFAWACDNDSAKHPAFMCRTATLMVRDARHERARYTHDDARLVAYM